MFSVNVPSLETLCYTYMKLGVGNVGSLVIGSATLRKLFIQDHSGNSCSIENEPRLDYALVGLNCYLDDKFMASLSSVMYLKLYLISKTDPYCTSIKFSELITCTIRPIRLQWLEPFMHFLQNSPKLKVLRIDTSNIRHEGFPRLFNRQSSFPECLSAHLEIFEWKQYGGHYEEKEVVKYILANSKCLKRARISIESTTSGEDERRMRKELESMYRVSTSSQLLFSTQFKAVITFQDVINL
ncbi:unnamed protein product [Arabidopsis halleri]